MAEAEKYKYTTTRPKPYIHNVQFPGVNGHHPGFIRRRSLLDPRASATARMVYCGACGKFSDVWSNSTYELMNIWHVHAQSAAAQGTLELVAPSDSEWTRVR